MRDRLEITLPSVLADGSTLRGDAEIALAATAAAGVVFLLGLGLASLGGLARLYVHTRHVYVAWFGVAWSAFWYLWSVRHLRGWVPRAGSAFQPGNEEWPRFCDAWLLRLRRMVALPTAVGVVLLWVYVALATHLGHRLWALPRFPQEWTHGPSLALKDVVLGLWVAPILAVVAPNIVGAVKYSLMVRTLGRLPGLTPSIPAAREGLRLVGRFGIVTGVAWSVAIFVIVACLGPATFDWGAVAAVGVLALLGLQLILWSQWELHSALARLRERLVEPLLEALRRPGHGEERARREAELRTILGDSTWVNAAGAVGVLLSSLGQLVLPAASLAISIVTRRGG